MKSQTKNSIEYWKLIRIGKAKKILEDFNGAIEAYSKAIEIDKNQYNAYFFRGNIYSKIKNHIEDRNFCMKNTSANLLSRITTNQNIQLSYVGIIYLILI